MYTIMKYYKPVPLPTLTYKSEYWMISGSKNQYIQTSEMRFLVHSERSNYTRDSEMRISEENSTEYLQMIL